MLEIAEFPHTLGLRQDVSIPFLWLDSHLKSTSWTVKTKSLQILQCKYKREVPDLKQDYSYDL